ncbi:hypothetical protein ASPSYDRAFT_42692, partial [Aspergillus sydowii CBS 593.65]
MASSTTYQYHTTTAEATWKKLTQHTTITPSQPYSRLTTMSPPRFPQLVTRYFGFQMVLPWNTGRKVVQTADRVARKWGS